jgi:hypothetical protein
MYYPALCRSLSALPRGTGRPFADLSGGHVRRPDEGLAEEGEELEELADYSYFLNPVY